MTLSTLPTVKRFSHLIGGKAVSSAEYFRSHNSSKLSDVLGEFPIATLEQVREACLTAREAFKTWGKTPAPIRGEIISQIGTALTREKENLSQLLSREMGKTLKEARGDVQEAIDTCHFFQSEGRRLYGQTVPSEMANKELKTYRRPLGVVGMVTAGNFPVAVPSWKIIPALVTGNTIVWKPSEDAPLTSYAFAKLLEEGGLPSGVLNVVFGMGGGSTGEHLVNMMDEGLLGKFAFTGSTAVGRQIGAIAGATCFTLRSSWEEKTPWWSCETPTSRMRFQVRCGPALARRVSAAPAPEISCWTRLFMTSSKRCFSSGSKIFV